MPPSDAQLKKWNKKFSVDFFNNHTDGLWNHVLVKLRFHDKLAGGVPRNEEVIRSWIESKNKELSAAEREKLVQATVSEMPDLTEEKSEKHREGFKSDEHGLYIENRCIKAMLKEAGNVMKTMLEKTGLKAKVAERVFVLGDRTHLHLDAPSGTDERVVHAMTMQGPRTSIRLVDYAENAEISFVVAVLDDPSQKMRVTIDEVAELLRYAQFNGLGALRSQGYGQFSVVEFRVLGEGEYERVMEELNLDPATCRRGKAA